MDDAPIFYSFRRCPYAMRARMALSVSQTPVQLREIALKDKPAEMLAASPKGTTPVLIDGDEIIDESLGVMAWALTRSDPEGWLAHKKDTLVAENDGAFKHHLDHYKYSTRYEGADREAHRDEAMKFIEKLEARLATSAYLSGGKRTLPDIAIFPFVRQFRIADEAWFDATPIPKVQSWLSGLMTSDLFQAVMKKYPLWKETGEEIGFPCSK